MVTKKLFVMILLGMFLISFVSAFELNPFATKKIYWDSIKIDTSDYLKEDFNVDYGIIKLSDTFLWIETDRIAEYSLSEVKESILNIEMIGKATIYKDGTLFDYAGFKDISNEWTSIKEGQYYIEVIKDNYVEIPDTYKTVCYTNESNTTTKDTKELESIELESKLNCVQEVNTTKLVNRPYPVWQEYNREILKAGNYKWKFAGTRFLNQKVDVIPVKDGTTFDEWVWFDNSWSYKKQINISTTDATSRGNISVLLNVTYNANMQSDFDDLRFLNSSEDGELNYWFDSDTYIDSNSVQVYVKLDRNISSSENISIYMYYGNPSATSDSDISTAGLFGDTFDTMDFTTNWQSSLESLYNVYETGILNLSDLGAGTNKLWMQNSVNEADFMIKKRLFGTLDASSPDFHSHIQTDGTWYDADAISLRGPIYFFRNGGYITNTGSLSSNTWYRESIQIASSYAKLNVTNDNRLQLGYNEGTADNSGSGMYLSFAVWSGTAQQQVDWVFVRRYNSLLASGVFGGEVAGIVDNTPTITQNSPANDSSYNTITSVTFNCSSTDDNGVYNISLWINDSLNYTLSNSTANQNLSFQTSTTLAEGNQTWYCKAWDGSNENVSETRTVKVVGVEVPIVTLTSPLNNAVIPNLSVDLQVEITYLAGNFSNITIDTREAYFGSRLSYFEELSGNGTQTINFTGTFSEGSPYYWNATLCYDRNVGGSECIDSVTNLFTIDTTPPTITLNDNPIVYNISQNHSINYTVTDNRLQSCLLGYNGDTYSIDCETTTQNTTNFAVTLGVTDFNISANDTAGNRNTTFYNLTFDSTPPTINPANNLTNLSTFSLPVPSNWNYLAEDTNLNSCYYTTSDNSTQTIVVCNSSIETSWTSGGEKEISYCANDTLGNSACANKTINIVSITTGQSESLDPAVEGATVQYTFEINVSGVSPIPSSSAIFIFNGTKYTPTKSTRAGGYFYTYNLEVPQGYGNTTGVLQDWLFNYSLTDYFVNSSSTTENTTIYSLAIDNCTLYNDTILNLNLYDEEDNNFINSSAGSNLEIDLQISKGSTFVNFSKKWTNENNVSICINEGLLATNNYTIDWIISFDSTDRVNEFHYLDNGTLSSESQFDDYTNQTLYLRDLLSADSTSFLFNYFDEDGLIVDDIIVHTFRKYIGEGLFREVERSKQNDDGDTIVHLVEEDVIYYFVITKEGQTLYTSNTYTALCDSAPCTIQLEESGGFQEFETDWDLIDGGDYSLRIDDTTRQVNLTFSTDEETTMNLTLYAMANDATYTAVDSVSSIGTTGEIIASVPISFGNTTFFGAIYQDGEYVDSQWVDFSDNAGDYLGITLSLFLASLIILSLGLMYVSEGALTIVFLIVGFVVTTILGLIKLQDSAGLGILGYLIIAGGLIIWKITKKQR